MITTEITEALAAVNNQYKKHELKRQCPDFEVLLVEVSIYNRIKDQNSTPNDLSAFIYN